MQQRSSIIVFVFIVAPLLLPEVLYAGWESHGNDRRLEVGVDFEQPYIARVDGDTVSERGDTTLGLHASYFKNPHWSFGVQVDFGLETQTVGQEQRVFISPGTAWYLAPENTWDPYLRFDVPMEITNNFDIGISGGIGMLWNLTEITGVEGLGLKYDFTVNYFFDSETLSLTVVRAALAYFW